MKFSHELLLIIIFNFEAIFQAPLVIVANYIMEFATIIKGARKIVSEQYAHSKNKLFSNGNSY